MAGEAQDELAPTAPVRERGSAAGGRRAWLARVRRSAWLAKVGRYAGGSVVAAVCSEATLVLLYGPAGVDPGVASVIAWIAGALPNYWLNRSWAWQRRGRPSLRHEVLPYAVIILLTLGLATLATRGADAWLQHAGVRADVRVTLVAGVFLGVYVVMFVLRFFLLDRLFARVAAHHDQPTHDRPTHDQPTHDRPTHDRPTHDRPSTRGPA